MIGSPGSSASKNLSGSFKSGDIIKAPGIKNKFLYIFKPPGWSHTGENKTAGKIRNDLIKTYLPATDKNEDHKRDGKKGFEKQFKNDF